MKSGVLYSGQAKTGELSISNLFLKLKTIAFSLRGLGFLCLVFSILGLGFIYTPLILAESRYFLSNLKIVKLFAKVPKSKLNPALGDVITWTVPDQNYSLYIPKIDAITKVIPNINAGDPTIYNEALKQGVAAAAGLASPGEKGTIYLFAHSTNSPINFARYNAVFYLLDKLKTKDTIEVVYRNKLHKYQVTSVQILASSDVSYLIPQNLEEKLILQTCYPPGTTWKRLVVIAKPI